MLGLSERLEEVEDHHLVLEQQEVSLGSQADLEEKPSGEVEDHLLSTE